MDCKKIQGLYEEYSSKVLPQNISREIEEHLSKCEKCHQEFEENKIISEALKVNASCTVDKIHLSNMISKAMRKINEISSPTIFNRFLFPLKELLFEKKLGFAVALIILGFVIGTFLQLRSSQKTQIVVVPPYMNKEMLPDSGIRTTALYDSPTPSSYPLYKRYLREPVYGIIISKPKSDKAKDAEEKSHLTAKEKEIVENIQKLSQEEPIDIDNTIKKGETDSNKTLAIFPKALGDSFRISDNYIVNTAGYNKAEKYASEGKYFEAIREYQNIIRNAPTSLLASKALYNIANLEFKELFDFEGALIDYQKFLDYYPDKYISATVKEEVLENIKLLTQSSPDKWESLKTYIIAQKKESPESFEYYFSIIEDYPNTPIADKCIDNLTESAINSFDATPLIAEKTLLFMQNYINSHTESDKLYPKMQLAIGDIINYGIKDREQALIEYSKIMRVNPSSEIARIASTRIQDIYRRSTKEEL